MAAAARLTTTEAANRPQRSATFSTNPVAPRSTPIPSSNPASRPVVNTSAAGFAMEITPPPERISFSCPAAGSYPMTAVFSISHRLMPCTKTLTSAAAATLRAILSSTGTFTSGSNSMTTAGSSAHREMTALSRSACSSAVSTALMGCRADSRAYTATVRTTGSTPVRNMLCRLSYSFVSVSAATSAAEEDAGEHRSPKYAPERIAPAVTASLTPPERASAISTIPAVPITPKEVPRA